LDGAMTVSCAKVSGLFPKCLRMLNSPCHAVNIGI
jgi:hypothetical protein